MIFFFILIPGLNNVLNAQPFKRFNTVSYKVNEGMLQSTLHDVAIDAQNFCWISYPNGIQKFDGRSFSNVPVQSGLPDDKQVQFFIQAGKHLLISHSKGISFYSNATNRFRNILTLPPGNRTPALFIGENSSHVFICDESGSVYSINPLTGASRIVFRISSNGEKYFTSLRSANKSINGFSMLINTGEIVRVNLNNGVMEKYKSLHKISTNSIEMISEDEVLFQFEDSLHLIHQYNFSSHQLSRFKPKGLDLSVYGRFKLLRSSKVNYFVNGSSLYAIDKLNNQVLYEMVNLNDKQIGNHAGISQIREDNFGNLIILTVFDGLRKVLTNNYPIRYFGQGQDVANHVLSVLPHKKLNRVLVGTSGNGILVFDTLQQLKQHLRMMPGSQRVFSVSCIIPLPDNNYLLAQTGRDSAILLKNDLKTLEWVKVHPGKDSIVRGFSFFGNKLWENGESALFQSQSAFYKVFYKPLSVYEYYYGDPYILSGLYHFGKIVIHADDELIFLNPSDFSVIKKIPFPNTATVRCYVSDGKFIYIGCNKGIFKIDENGNIIEHLDKSSGLPDECIYAMVVDKSGLIWCSSNKGIFRINADKTIHQLKKEDGLQENEFNTAVVAKSEDGELYFGGVNGVSSFYPQRISGYSEKIEVLLSNLRVNNHPLDADTAIWNLDKLVLDHDQNNLAFEFLAIAPNNPEQYVYQYRMIGVDKEWLMNDGMQPVRYYLPPGDYTLQLYASRAMDIDAKPLKKLKIVIRQPFYKTWWFIAACIASLIALVIYGVNNYNRRKYAHHLDEIRRRHALQVQRENISRDLHDNIGVYANAVLYHSELLQNDPNEQSRKSLMRDLQFASKDILLSLRETIWAFKKSTYTAPECWMRLRNFLHPMDRYYRNISFRQEGEVPETRIFAYQVALNLVRIVQEAVTNSIKHAQPGEICIKSVVGEKGEWRIRVEDDGIGFNAHSEETGEGLKNMHKRAKDGGFRINVISSPGGGTTVEILV